MRSQKRDKLREILMKEPQELTCFTDVPPKEKKKDVFVNKLKM